MRTNKISAVLIWTVYSLAGGAGLFLITMSAAAIRQPGTVWGVAAGIGILLITGLLTVLLHRAFCRKNKEIRDENSAVARVVRGLFLVALLAATVIFHMTRNWNLEDAAILESAKVTTQTFAPECPHGGYALYVRLLHEVFLIFGNKNVAAAGLQLVLLLSAMLTVYFGVRRLAGTIPAFATIILLGFGKYATGQLHGFSPFFLFAAFFGVALIAISFLGTENQAEEPDNGRPVYPSDKERHFSIAKKVIAGALIGICCYLDLSAMTLLLVLTGVICFGSRERRASENGVADFMICLLAALAGFCVMHMNGWLGKGMPASVLKQVSIYVPGDFRVPASVGTSAASWDVICIFVMISVGIFGFWCSGRIKDKAVWMCGAILIGAMMCFGMGMDKWFDEFSVLYLLCAVTGGCALMDLLIPKAISPVRTENEETSVSMEEDQKIPDKTEEAGEELEQIQFIENPLPLPKKKEHKTLDYDYEVAEDDDFDIQ